MTTPDAIVPLLLAAGASTRMKRPKALCEFDGRTALELALEACRGAGVARPVVVLGDSAAEIRSRVPLRDADVVVNRRPELGQTSSLKCGLSRVGPAAAFLIYPVDHPLIEATDVRAVVEAYAKGRESGKQIFIPSYGLKRGHPVAVDRELKKEFEALPDDAPARALIHRFSARIQYVDAAGPNVLMDMDTPEDYDRCLEAYRQRELSR